MVKECSLYVSMAAGSANGGCYLHTRGVSLLPGGERGRNCGRVRVTDTLVSAVSCTATDKAYHSQAALPPSFDE